MKNKDMDIELINASRHGDIERVKQLIAGGANVNAADKYGRTALMDAAWYGHTETVKKLIDAGADVNEQGKTALMYAKNCDNIDIIKGILLKERKELHQQIQTAEQNMERTIEQFKDDIRQLNHLKMKFNDTCKPDWNIAYNPSLCDSFEGIICILGQLKCASQREMTTANRFIENLSKEK